MEPKPLFSEYASRVPTPAERRRAMGRGRAERSRAAFAMAANLRSWLADVFRPRQRIVVPPRGDLRIVACTDC
ncbi:hypothetical protein [Caenispirillum salinarum]|uniref:hypothetical protein n=1 Tax=Caenispirillum salinarum TaxID=859058 RepID=UPI00385045CA